MESTDNIRDNILNDELDLDERLKILESVYQYDQSFALECINTLSTSFLLQPTSLLEDFLAHITSSKKMDAISLFQIVSCIYMQNKKVALPLFVNIIKRDNDNIQISIYVDIYKILFTSNENEGELMTLFQNQILQSTKINEVYKMKIINGIVKSEDVLQCYKTFIYTYVLDNFDNKNKIIAAQYLLSPSLAWEAEIGKNKIKYIEDILLSIARNDPEYNTRADACDILLNTSQREAAGIILKELSRERGKFNTIYNNRQNVHSSSLEKSIQKIVEQLSNVNLSSVTTEEIEEILLRHAEEKDKESIKTSIFRIIIDNGIYNGNSLVSILNRIWTVINSKKERDTLINRLIEELVDMSNTCSSGHLSRLVNTLSGFGYELNIGFEDQIRSNLFARFEKYIKQIPEMKLTVMDTESKTERLMSREELEDYQANILEELISTNEIKPNINRFFRECIGKITDELRVEFKEHVNENEFDEIMRRSIIAFEN